MHRRLIITVATIALAGPALAQAATGSRAQESAASPLRVEAQVRVAVGSAPGRSITRQARMPKIRGDWDQLWIRIAGKLTPVADHRGCSLDSVRHRVMVTVNACGKRLIVSTATTGRRPARVVVKLVKFAQPPPDATRGSGAPAPVATPPPTPAPTEEPDSDAYVPPEPEDCAEEPDLEGC